MLRYGQRQWPLMQNILFKHYKTCHNSCPKLFYSPRLPLKFLIKILLAVLLHHNLQK